MRKILIAIGALCVIVLGLLILNWSTIDRILRVKDFLHPKKVVHNFAHAKDGFHYKELTVTAPMKLWTSTPKALPANLTVLDETLKTKDFLTNTDAVALLVIKDGNILFEDYYQGAKTNDHRIS